MNFKEKLIFEGINFLKIYKKATPYLEFNAFVESLKRDKNKKIIESIQEGISVVLEGIYHDPKVYGDKGSEYSKSIKSGFELFKKHPEKVKNAEKNPTTEENKGILIQSVFPTLAKYAKGWTRKWANQSSQAMGGLSEEEITRYEEEVMGKLVEWVIEDVLPQYDETQGASFNTYLNNRDINNKARITVMSELKVPEIKKWEAGKNYTGKDTKVRHNGSVFKKTYKGEIPEEDRNIEPGTREGSYYWEKSKATGTEFEKERIDRKNRDSQSSHDDKKMQNIEKKLSENQPREEIGAEENIFKKVNNLIDSFSIKDEHKSYLKEKFEKDYGQEKYSKDDLGKKHGLEHAAQRKRIELAFQDAMKKSGVLEELMAELQPA